jgi:hypothetical protein
MFILPWRLSRFVIERRCVATKSRTGRESRAHDAWRQKARTCPPLPCRHAARSVLAQRP